MKTVYVAQHFAPYGRIIGVFTSQKKAYDTIRPIYDYETPYSYKSFKEQLSESDTAQLEHASGTVGVMRIELNEEGLY